MLEQSAQVLEFVRKYDSNIVENTCVALEHVVCRYTPHDWMFVRMPGDGSDIAVNQIRETLMERNSPLSREFTRNGWLMYNKDGATMRIQLQGSFCREPERTYAALIVPYLSSNEEVHVERAIAKIKEMHTPKIILAFFCLGDNGYNSLCKKFPGIPIVYGHRPYPPSSLQAAE